MFTTLIDEEVVEWDRLLGISMDEYNTRVVRIISIIRDRAGMFINRVSMHMYTSLAKATMINICTQGMLTNRVQVDMCSIKA